MNSLTPLVAATAMQNFKNVSGKANVDMLGDEDRVEEGGFYKMKWWGWAIMAGILVLIIGGAVFCAIWFTIGKLILFVTNIS